MSEGKLTIQEDEITCPHCGNVYSDSWEYAPDGVLECESCGESFGYQKFVQVSYDTWELPVQVKQVETKEEFEGLKITQWSSLLDPHLDGGLIDLAFSESGSILVAIVSGSLVGYVIMGSDGLHAIEVKEKYKRQGIATKLCEAAKVKRAWGIIEDESAELFKTLDIEWEDCRSQRVRLMVGETPKGQENIGIMSR